MHKELWELHAIFRSIVSLKAMEPRADRNTLRDLRRPHATAGGHFGSSSLERAYRKHFILMDGLTRGERLALLSFLVERPVTSSYDLRVYELYALLEFGFTEDGMGLSEDFVTLLTLWKQREVQPCSN